MDVEIKILQAKDIEDFNQLLTVFDIVFEYEQYTRPDKEYLQKLLAKSSFIAIVAKMEGRVIAGLTAYALDQYHSNMPMLYIHDLAVLSEYQRKGVGSKLIQFTNAYCRENGFQEMFIQAETEDDYAVKFYRSTQPTGELEVNYFFYKASNETDPK